jgi:hypothetical protein
MFLILMSVEGVLEGVLESDRVMGQRRKDVRSREKERGSALH